MKTGVLVMVGWLIAGSCFGDSKLVSVVEETNNWEAAVALSKRGLCQDMGGWAAVCNYGFVSNSITNGIYSYHYENRCIQPCTQEHVADFPKTKERVYGVQFLRTYESETDVDGENVVTRWNKYTYPHRKITVTTTEELRRVTTVTTNDVKVCKESK